MSMHDVRDRQIHERSLELAALAVDFELNRDETAELEDHLATCATCTRRAAAMRRDAMALARPLMLEPSPRVDGAVYGQIARRPASPRRLVLVAAVVLLVLALLSAAAIGAYLLRTWQTQPITVVPQPTNPVALVSPSPEASAPPVEVGKEWATIDFAAGSGGSIEAATFAGADVIGVGGGGCIPESGAPTQCYGAAWTAASGASWVQAPDQPGLEVGSALGTSDPPARMLDVAAGPGGMVAVGYADDGRARIWGSTDGRTWRRAELDAGSTALVPRVGAVAAGAAGYVIVGWILDPQGPRARAAAWSSPDGVTWTRAEDTAAMDVGACFETGLGLSCGGMHGVVATASGYVAVGADHARARGTEPGRPAAWTSPDGLHWAQANTGLDFVGALSDVEIGGPGFVAVGTTCPPGCFEATAGSVAATSVDGSTWRFNAVAGAIGPQRVASAGGRVFAISVLNQDAEPKVDLQLWQTEDGVAWRRTTGLPPIPARSTHGVANIAATNGRLIVVGWGSVTGVDGVTNFAMMSPPITTQSAPDPNPSAPTPSTIRPSTPSVSDVVPTIATLPASGNTAGLTWTLGHTDPNTYGNQIAYGPAGWMHAVSNRPGRPAPRVMLSADLHTWSDVTPSGSSVGCVALAASRSAYVSLCESLETSSDGRTWRAPGDPPLSDGTFKGGPKQFYSDGSTFLATTGGYPSSSVIWTSPDGARWAAVHLPGAPRVIIDAVAGRQSGGFVIAGRVADTEASFDADRTLPVGQRNPGRQAIWTSTDGSSWTVVPLGPVFDGARITGLATDGPGGGIVAVGHFGVVADGAPVTIAVWRSADLVTWQHLTGPGFDLREGNVGDARVIGLADRWLVVASHPRTVGGALATTGDGVAAGSEDGTAWWSTDPIWGVGPTPYTITGLIATNGRLVALDDTLINSATVDPSARIWVSP